MAEQAVPANPGEQPIATMKRLDFKKQSLDDAYAAPANLLEIEVANPETHGLARNRYTDYEVRMRVSPSAAGTARKACGAPSWRVTGKESISTLCIGTY